MPAPPLHPLPPPSSTLHPIPHLPPATSALTSLTTPPHNTCPPYAAVGNAAPRTSTISRQLPSVPDAIIPKLPRGSAAWRAVIDQWEKPNPTTGVPPLKNWDKSWYTGAMKAANGVKYGIRQMIATEFNRCVDQCFIHSIFLSS